MINFFRNVVLWIIILFVIIGAIVLLIFLIPRGGGDAFVADLLRLDIPAMEARLCDGTTLTDITGILSASGDNLSAFLAQGLGAPIELPGREQLLQALSPDAAYYPFTGAYVFHVKLVREIDILGFKLAAGLRSPDFTLTIGHPTPWSACVMVG